MNEWRKQLDRDQWWNSLSAVCVMTISRSLHASITTWSLVEPPGAAMYSTPLYTRTQPHECPINCTNCQCGTDWLTDWEKVLSAYNMYKPLCTTLVHNTAQKINHTWGTFMCYQIMKIKVTTIKFQFQIILESTAHNDLSVWIIMYVCMYVITDK